MTYLESLTRVLSETFPKVSPDNYGLVLQGPKTSVRVSATEADIESRVRLLAKDGLIALGPVQDDPTGLAAGIGLLAVHIEELVGSDPTITRIDVTSTGVHAHTKP